MTDQPETGTAAPGNEPVALTFDFPGVCSNATSGWSKRGFSFDEALRQAALEFWRFSIGEFHRIRLDVEPKEPEVADETDEGAADGVAGSESGDAAGSASGGSSDGGSDSSSF